MLIHVCPLSKVTDTVAAARASHLVSLVDLGTPVDTPPSIAKENHLFIGVHDICDPTDGLLHPCEDHVDELLRFVRVWPRRQAVVIHCYAGISRSTAAAFVTACTVYPERSEQDIACTLRAASRTATPNARIVALADRALGREGRMIRAIAEIGRGEQAYEGVPFSLAL